MHILPIFKLDVSQIEGTYCYCSDSSKPAIRKKVSEIPLKSIHLLGTGDFHYLSLFFLERIEKDFSLVLYDNHPDDQEGAFGAGMLTCGSWVKEARERFPHLVGDFRNPEDSICVNTPIYLSIDLDVLSGKYARTDWDQGEWTLEQLNDSIRKQASGHEIIGVDICGGLLNPTDEESELNESTIELICASINGILSR